MMHEYEFTDGNMLPWRKSTSASGVEVKELGSKDGRAMQLVRFMPGTEEFPLHTHDGPEFIYLFEVAAFQQGRQLLPGWGSVAATGTTDDHFHSPAGCVFLTVYTE